MPLERDGEFILERFHVKTYTPAQMQKFMEVVPPDTSIERFQAVLGSGLVADIFHADAKISNRLAVRCALGLGALPSTLGSHVVDYDMSLDEMIVAGNYDWKNDDITVKRFPIVGKGKVEFEDTIFHFDRNISSEDAVKEILAANTENPWEPAKIENTLAYGTRNPEEQRKFPIVGLGSVGQVLGGRYVPYLGRDGSGRYLRLRWWALAGMPAAVSWRFAKSLRPRFLDPSGLSLGILDPWFTACEEIHAPFFIYQNDLLGAYRFWYIMSETNEKSKVKALGNLSATPTTRV